MIWNPISPAGERDSAVVSYLADEIATLCGKHTPPDAHVRELALAVQAFLDGKSAPSMVTTCQLNELATAALLCIGEKNAARRLFIFGTGLVKHAEWEVVSGDAMWILDLKRITLQSDHSMELVFFNCLSAVLEAIADVWDGSHGSGNLGLMRVCAVAAELTGTSRKKPISGLSAEIMDFCRRRLERIAAARGWNTCPRVLNMDG